MCPRHASRDFKELKQQNRRSNTCMLTIKSICQDGSASTPILKQNLLYWKDVYSWRVQYSTDQYFIFIQNRKSRAVSGKTIWFRVAMDFLSRPPSFLSPTSLSSHSFLWPIFLSPPPSMISPFSLSDFPLFQKFKKAAKYFAKKYRASAEIRLQCRLPLTWINQTTALDSWRLKDSKDWFGNRRIYT